MENKFPRRFCFAGKNSMEEHFRSENISSCCYERHSGSFSKRKVRLLGVICTVLKKIYLTKCTLAPRSVFNRRNFSEEYFQSGYFPAPPFVAVQRFILEAFAIPEPFDESKLLHRRGLKNSGQVHAGWCATNINISSHNGIWKKSIEKAQWIDSSYESLIINIVRCALISPHTTPFSCGLWVLTFSPSVSGTKKIELEVYGWDLSVWQVKLQNYKEKFVKHKAATSKVC